LSWDVNLDEDNDQMIYILSKPDFADNHDRSVLVDKTKFAVLESVLMMI